MQFVERTEWIPRFDIHYHLGVDGISVLFVLLNSFVTVLVVFFVPKFAVMFERLRERGELPWATELLLWISETARSPVMVFLILPAVIALGVFLYMRAQTPEGRRTADYLRIKIPMAGPIFLAFAVARFCRVLGTLLHNGVPILKALEISREAAGNKK